MYKAPEKMLIGYCTLSEDTEFINNGFECAAWYEKIAVKAGKYPVYAYAKDFTRCKDGSVWLSGSVYANYDGKIVSDYFGALWCGSPIGTYDKAQNEGKAAKYICSIYSYSFAEQAFYDEVELLPEYRVEAEKRYSDVWDKWCRYYKIIKNDD